MTAPYLGWEGRRRLCPSAALQGFGETDCNSLGCSFLAGIIVANTVFVCMNVSLVL